MTINAIHPGHVQGPSGVWDEAHTPPEGPGYSLSFARRLRATLLGAIARFSEFSKNLGGRPKRALQTHM